MRMPLKTFWMTMMAASVWVGGGLPAAAQTRVVPDADQLDTGRGQTVVVTQRPLRTFRGDSVRIGSYADDEKSIGVVRALRSTPGYDQREAYSRLNRADRSDRWYDRHVSRRSILLDAYRDPYPRIEQSIGVVRSFRDYQPPQRNLPETFTNDNAPGSSSQDKESQNRAASSTQAPGDFNVTAVTAVEVPAAVRDDAWALLDQGYYREARQRFAAMSTADDATTLTGHALSAALSGDLQGGSALMPRAPMLPEGMMLSPAAAQRMQQTREFLYADNTAMQDALQSLLDAGVAPEVSAK